MSGPWLALGYCGYEFTLTLWPFDLHVGPMADDEDVQETCTDAGSFTSQPVGFCPSIVPDWERTLTGYDEPDEAE